MIYYCLTSPIPLSREAIYVNLPFAIKLIPINMEKAWIPARGSNHHGGPRHCEKDVTYSALTPVSPPYHGPGHGGGL